MTNRQKYFAILGLFGFALTTQAAQQRPNIVLIVSDDQGWTDFGFMGHPAIRTPNLDKLAEQSATFRRGYVPTALCRPSLATLVTGLYAHQSLICGNDPADTRANQQHATKSGKELREILISNIDKNPTLPRLLAQQGYLSFQCGKWWEGSYQRGGFTHGMTRGYPEKGGRHGDDGLTIGRDGMQPVNDFIDTAIEAKKPFFLWYAPLLPHTPHNPPKRLLVKYQKRGRTKSIASYYAMCDSFDETCGQLLDRLDAKGVAENTLVIYVTDNGWVQQPNGSYYAARSKRSPYELGTRTPIMFRWPAKMKPSVRPELCSSIDIAPTILAAAGADIPKQMPGLNLLVNLEQGTPIERNAIFGEAFAHDIADIENPEASLLYRWVIRHDHKLLLTYDGRLGRMRYPPKDARPQLYDLKVDPHEKANLAAKQPQLVKELSGLITDWYPMKQRKAGGMARARKPARAKAVVPTPTLTDVPYGKHERHILDFWKVESATPTPLMFVIHGGGWRGGDKDRVHRFVDIQKLLKAGISVAANNYRFIKHAEADSISPPVKVPLYDAARALQFVRSKATQWNIDKRRIGAAGGSAGACSSLWLAFHDDLADPNSNNPIARESTRLWCAAVTGAQTTLDPRQMKEWTPNSRYGGHAFGFGDFKQFLSGREQILPWFAEYSPYALATADDPPVYLIYKSPPDIGQDQKDPTHTSNFGVKLQEHLHELKVECELVYPGAPSVIHDTPTAFLIDKLSEIPAE